MKSAGKRTQGSGITRVEKELNGNRITITEKIEIEKKIGSVANNTPLRREPLRKILGEQMNFDTNEKILKGKINMSMV